MVKLASKIGEFKRTLADLVPCNYHIFTDVSSAVHMLIPLLGHK